jgi:hypothetical protein
MALSPLRLHVLFVLSAPDSFGDRVCGCFGPTSASRPHHTLPPLAAALVVTPSRSRGEAVYDGWRWVRAGFTRVRPAHIRVQRARISPVALQNGAFGPNLLRFRAVGGFFWILGCSCGGSVGEKGGVVVDIGLAVVGEVSLLEHLA